MSRIGKKPIPLPAAVNVTIAPDRLVQVKGPKGSLAWQLPLGIAAKIEGTNVQVAAENDDRKTKALFGLSRSLLNNMVAGVTSGFSKKLEIHGVGFRANVTGEKLNLSLGYSHPVEFPIPQGIKIVVQDNTKVTIEGIDKQLVGQVAADIRAYYPPEPYKGKGVRYSDETVRRKAGKSVKK